MRLRLLAVAFLVAAAGCGSIVGLDGGGRTETVTPAPVPTATPTPEDPRDGVAPGVDTTGVFDVDYLAENHVEALASTSYAWSERNREVRTFGETGTNITRTQRVTVVNETTYRRQAENIDDRIDGEYTFFGEYDVYGGDDREFAKFVSFENGQEYRTQPTRDRGGQYVELMTDSVRRYVDLDNATVTRADAGDRPHFRVVGTRDELPQFGEISNYSTRAVIREDGVIRSLNVSYDYVTSSGVAVTVQYEYALESIGTATVEEPQWLETARNRTDR